MCKYQYRPGVNQSHWAYASCDISDAPLYLSRISSHSQEVGCADWYNGRQCCRCETTITMDYSLFKENPNLLVEELTI